jgi:hypothetical protein
MQYTSLSANVDNLQNWIYMHVAGWPHLLGRNSVERKYYNTIDFTPKSNHHQSIHYCIILNVWVAISYIRLLWLATPLSIVIQNLVSMIPACTMHEDEGRKDVIDVL